MKDLPQGTLEPMRTNDLQCRFCGNWFQQNNTRHYCSCMGCEITINLSSEIKH
jgi:hypothetical protein